MLQSRDHDRRRRAASSSDDDDDEMFEDSSVDPAAQQAADMALARLAEHVFRRRPPTTAPVPDRESDSSSSSSSDDDLLGEPCLLDDDHPDAIADSLKHEEGAPAVSHDEPDDVPESESPVPESGVGEIPDPVVVVVANDTKADVDDSERAAAQMESPRSDREQAADGEHGDGDVRPRREFVEPPIPEGRKFRFYMHDDRDDDDDVRAPRMMRKSRADGEWKHDLFQRLLVERRPYRGRASHDRPRGRWVPKGAHQLAVPAKVVSSTPEWSRETSEWKPDGYEAHTRGPVTPAPQRWVPKATVAPAPVPDSDHSQMTSSWSVPEPVKAPAADQSASGSAQIDEVMKPDAPATTNPDTPSTMNPEASSTTTMNPEAPMSTLNPEAPSMTMLNPEAPSMTVMNPEAVEFQLPASSDADQLVYVADAGDPQTDYCWIYDDGTVLAAPASVYDYPYPMPNVDDIANAHQPIYFYPADLPVDLDSARNDSNAAIPSTTE